MLKHLHKYKKKEPDALPPGFELTDDNKRYTILNYISCGAFGYTYRAEMLNCSNGSKEIVAIKEFYPRGIGDLTCYRENEKTCRVMYDETLEAEFESLRKMFRSEPVFLLSMVDIADNHVTEVKSLFEYEATGTTYYVMKFYAGESLKDMIINDQVPSSEKLIIDKIVIPLCKGSPCYAQSQDSTSRHQTRQYCYRREWRGCAHRLWSITAI